MLKHRCEYFLKSKTFVVFLYSGKDEYAKPSFAKGKTSERVIAQS